MRLLLFVVRYAWHAFLTLCAIAGWLADWPYLLDVLHTQGILALGSTVSAGTIALIRNEPIGSATLLLLLVVAGRRLSNRSRAPRKPPMIG